MEPTGRWVIVLMSRFPCYEEPERGRCVQGVIGPYKSHDAAMRGAAEWAAFDPHVIEVVTP